MAHDTFKICPECHEKNNPSFPNCWKCHRDFKTGKITIVNDQKPASTPRLTKDIIWGSVGGVVVMKVIIGIAKYFGVYLGGLPAGGLFLAGYFLAVGTVRRNTKSITISLLSIVGVIVLSFAFAFLGLHSVSENQNILDALEARDVEKVRKIVSSGVDPNIVIAGMPLISFGIKDGEDFILKTLVELGADVNIKSKFGRTPLHEAALHGQVEIANYLISHGADVNARNPRGETPLFYAEEGLKFGPKRTEHHALVAKLLRDNGGTK